MSKQLMTRLQQIKNGYAAKAAVAAGLMASAGAAMADVEITIDTTPVMTAMGNAVTAIALVGTAYLSVKIAIKVWPWIASAMGR